MSSHLKLSQTWANFLWPTGGHVQIQPPTIPQASDANRDWNHLLMSVYPLALAFTVFIWGRCMRGDWNDTQFTHITSCNPLGSSLFLTQPHVHSRVTSFSEFKAAWSLWMADVTVKTHINVVFVIHAWHHILYSNCAWLKMAHFIVHSLTKTILIGLKCVKKGKSSICHV